MPSSRVKQAKRETYNQYLFFNIIYTLTDIVTWSYFIILLLRASNNSVAVVFLNQGVMYAGIMFGFLLGGKLFHRSGYLNTFRLANLLFGIVSLLTLLTLPRILDVHLVIAMAAGIAKGLYWLTYHMFNIREVHGHERGRLISLILSVNTTLSVVLPVLAGALISTHGYDWVFLLGGCIYLLSCLLPWKFNKVPRDNLRKQDFWSLSKKKGFRPWAVINISNSFFTNLRTMSLTVLPFLFIGDEFGVGVLTSIVGLVGASLVLWHRNDEIKKKLKWGWLGGATAGLATVGLIIVWTLPALIIRSLIAKLSFSLYTPVSEDFIYRNRESMTGDFKNEFAVEVQEYSEFFLFIGRMLGLAFFILLFYILEIDQNIILKLILAISLLREVPGLFLRIKLSEHLKKGKKSSTSAAIHPLISSKSEGYAGLRA